MKNLYVVKCNVGEITTNNAFYVICDACDIDDIAYEMAEDLYDPDGSIFTEHVRNHFHRSKDATAATAYAYFQKDMAISVFILRIEEDTDWNDIDEAHQFYGCDPQQLLDEDRLDNPDNYIN